MVSCNVTSSSRSFCHMCNSNYMVPISVAFFLGPNYLQDRTMLLQRNESLTRKGSTWDDFGVLGITWNHFGGHWGPLLWSFGITWGDLGSFGGSQGVPEAGWGGTGTA